MTKKKIGGVINIFPLVLSKFELVMQKLTVPVYLCKEDKERGGGGGGGGCIVVVCIGKQMYLMRLSSSKQLCAFQT